MHRNKWHVNMRCAFHAQFPIKIKWFKKMICKIIGLCTGSVWWFHNIRTIRCGPSLSILICWLGCWLFLLFSRLFLYSSVLLQNWILDIFLRSNACGWRFLLVRIKRFAKWSLAISIEWMKWEGECEFRQSLGDFEWAFTKISAKPLQLL